MFLLTVTLLAAGFVDTIATSRALSPGRTVQAVLQGGLWLIVAGTAITVARRALRLARALKNP
jgi:hypothetical protein